jgi:hypothetical protein
MKKAGNAEDGEVRAEYDFSKARKNPYAQRANRNTNIVVIEPELFEVFPSSDAVNEALRLMVKAVALASQAAVEHPKAS